MFLSTYFRLKKMVFKNRFRKHGISRKKRSIISPSALHQILSVGAHIFLVSSLGQNDTGVTWKVFILFVVKSCIIIYMVGQENRFWPNLAKKPIEAKKKYNIAISLNSCRLTFDTRSKSNLRGRFRSVEAKGRLVIPNFDLI